MHQISLGKNQTCSDNSTALHSRYLVNLYDLKERGGEEKAEVMRYHSLQAVQLPLAQLTSNKPFLL
jgi:hypothetical protein